MVVTPREQIAELLARFAWTYDEGDFAAHADCFVPDAIFEIQPPGAALIRFEGREAIVKLQSDARASQGDQRRHVITNLVFDHEDDHSAQVRSYLTLCVIANSRLTVALTGWFRDRVVLQDGAWRFETRHLALDEIGSSGPS